MRILNVAYPLARVHQKTAGGAEHVLAMLDRALVEAGHQSCVVACQGSEVCGELRTVPFPTGELDEEARRTTWAKYRTAIAESIATWQPDLVHFHGIDFPEYLPAPGVPVVATLHLPPGWYDPATFALGRPQTWLHCVSRSQEQNCPESVALLPFIPNGVNDDLYAPHIRRRSFALSLGRICPEKGYDHAIAAARSAEVPYVLAGQVHAYAEHQKYFEEQILPHCGENVRFIGPVGWKAKRRLLNAARCVLIPSLAPETSSLVAMEAAMCGTPVVAFRAGALPEVVEHGVTGFLVDDASGMAHAIRATEEIDPVRCRAVAQTRFSADIAISRYFGMYREILAR